jgi:hypothetical protein
LFTGRAGMSRDRLARLASIRAQTPVDVREIPHGARGRLGRRRFRSEHHRATVCQPLSRFTGALKARQRSPRDGCFPPFWRYSLLYNKTVFWSSSLIV